ncbi:uncharacterized protein A1O5_00852 [Cladophialophora psammophila CBS 110553]|uniref:Vps72/YL1 C-terminal domain-containing protein n=1 Tax=Cladophialophora psammophila CBS 110553 TaxID=1182543 RepID=W9Y1M0_9EURO|nr:uncharacterized protein A1O5_00852 [Cladophialophora psammophila CBS 110553]EXJ76344.1 hypothetical protein A1O5_00852 [Cladophialophora psammophila CBS 110553]
MTNKPMDDTPQLSPTESSEDESDEELVETLVAGRERRKTAGNRYDRDMILEEVANVDEQDEVTLLFADNEEEEDEEFRSGDDDEDADMSSSDGDDQGPNAATDDLEGEKELQKQAKVDRAKKRKADLALTSIAGIRKKLKTDHTRPAVASVAAKPSKKKKERVTWVHDRDSGRSSLRKQTIAHRAETIARLKESEAQSKKLKALKEQREKERARDAPKELTQADRLAEAARVERQNAKSLNRWEAMEKKRQEELAAKLAALKDRKLEGPVITWLSAKAKWVGPKLNKIGTRDVTDWVGPPEMKKRGRKSKAYLEQLAAERNVDSGAATAAKTSTVGTPQASLPISDQPKELTQETTATTTIITTTTTATVAPVVENAQPEITLTSPLEQVDSFLRGIHEYTNMQTDRRVSPVSQHSNVQRDSEKRPEIQQSSSTLPENIPGSVVEATPIQNSSSKITENATVKPEIPPEQTHVPEAIPPSEQTQPSAAIEDAEQIETPGTIVQAEVTQLAGTIEPATAPEPPPVVEDSTRNLVILENFQELSTESRQEYSLFYNHCKTAKPAKPAKSAKHNHEVCPITVLTARYRDPDMGIAFANAAAYKTLHELKEHKFMWSTMLGCYVGREGATPARGVPEGWG